MIKGKVKEERVYIDRYILNYRKLDALNQSMIKLFDSDPIRFFEEFKMGKKRKDRKNTSLIIGDLVDFYLLACRADEQEFENRFDEKFALFSGTKGMSQVYVLADILFDVTEECLENGRKCTFEDRFRDAYNIIHDIKDVDGNPKYYKGKSLDKVLEDFKEKGEEYFQTKMDNIGKLVIDLSLVDKAKTVAKKMADDPFTKDIFSGDDSKEVFTHFAIEWDFPAKNGKIKCKAEIDRLEIDHDRKIIQPDDLKTTYDNESFEYNYIKNSYYLQNAFYHLSVKQWAINEGLAYHVNPMRFIVGDTSFNNRRPLVYVTSNRDIEAGFKGFYLNGTKYRGIEELINEILWCEENNIWNCSKETFDNNGILKLNISYDKS